MEKEGLKEKLLSGNCISISSQSEDLDFVEFFYSETIKEFIVALNGKWMICTRSFKAAFNRAEKYILKYNLINEDINSL